MERLITYNPIPLSPNISNLLSSLNKIAPYIIHSISILYIPPNCEFTDTELYSVKKGSSRFNKFLSQLGNLINTKNSSSNDFIGGLPKIKGVYGVLWKNSVMQVFFHSNTLLCSLNTSEIKEFITKNNVTIIWNENIENQLTKEIAKKINDKVVISINPLSINFSNVDIYPVIFFAILVY